MKLFYGIAIVLCAGLGYLISRIGGTKATKKKNVFERIADGIERMAKAEENE